MSTFSYITAKIAAGEARKANGPVEHWLTTLETGFWGFDVQKAEVWHQLKAGDVMVFQAVAPNPVFVSKDPNRPKITGFIGAGIVSEISEKNEPRWLSEVVESRVHKLDAPKFWPHLVHFSDVIWFGDVDKINASHIQQSIEEADAAPIDLSSPIRELAKNILTAESMREAGFSFGAQGTGGYLTANAELLSTLIASREAYASSRTYRSASINLAITTPSPILSGDFTCGGEVPPKAKKKNAGGKTPPPRIANNRQIDYVLEAEKNKALGDLGERIILAHERTRVQKELGPDYADKVVYVSRDEGDSAGYDIRSWREVAGAISEYFIEVKTTSGNENTPFFISANELQFAESNTEKYELVRIHSLSQAKKQYLVYRWAGQEMLDKTRVPVAFRVDVTVE
ncbi:DUF3883 domain-containing protein [Pseudomonas fluorescens]|uniref:DUF3883 domain-containing protein n=1 Tax=Pseudomonas fluorescens TaxID=294 RepID=UPI0012402793|nr:DUF3883 domain-containing protein [Pseudomonas fluorescens]VVO77137.1 hypothetical protein PS898_01614 [Pseudomonas fluorescens]